MRFLLLSFIIGFSGLIFAQINPSDACTGVPALPVNNSCTLNTYFINGSYANGALFAPSCGSGNNRDDGWYSFVATATSITIQETSTDRDHLIQVRTACGGGTAVAGSCSQSAANVTNTVNLTGLSIGVTYYIQVQRRSGNNGDNMNGTICVYETPIPDAPWPGEDLGTLTCTSTTTVGGTTAGANIDCTVSSSGDHIYQFSTTQISALSINLCGSSYDTQIHLFDLGHGDCMSGAMNTNDDACGVQSTINITCLPIGTYVVVIEGSGAATGTYDMDIILSSCGCPTPPSNDEACSATPLTVNTSCIMTADDNIAATSSAVADPGCGNWAGADVWYSVTVPTGGWLTFETSAGTMTDAAMAIYSGACGAPTLIQCDNNSGPGSMPEIERQDLTPGSTVLIRMWENGGNFEGTYNICVHEPDCSTNLTNDFCEDAGILTPSGGSTFASSTAALYTVDNPDNVDGVFCGSIQNNSWYQFVATATSHTFPVTAVVGCSAGIQAQVYDYTGGSGSCCHTFTSVSNCYNPGNTTLGTVTATGLTIGNTYILMIDGYAGANCDFSISGWTATNILPVEVVNFDAKETDEYNLVLWKTKSELNSKWFIIERSSDGINFSEIGKLNAAGNSSLEKNYFYKDYDIFNPKLYYRLKVVDYDGTFEYSDAVMVMRTDVEMSIYPNPTTGIITINFYNQFEGDYTIRYTDAIGRIIVEEIKVSSGNSAYTSEVLSNLPAGIYFVEVMNTASSLIHQEKIIRTE